MNKQLIIGGVVAFAVVGAGTVYFLTNSDSGKTNNTETQQATSTETQQDSQFDAASTSDASFVATITTANDDKTVTGVMQRDSTSGNISYATNYDGQESLIVYTSDAYYFCQTADQCIKYPLNQIGDSSFDPSSYEYTTEELASYKNSSTYEGKKDCASGTCDAWKVTTDGYESTIYVDSTSKRIVQVEGSTPTGSVKIVYDYKDVTIAPPANAQEIPNLQQ